MGDHPNLVCFLHDELEDTLKVAQGGSYHKRLTLPLVQITAFRRVDIIDIRDTTAVFYQFLLEALLLAGLK